MKQLTRKKSELGTVTVRTSGLDWNFHGVDTKYLTHNIHRYSGKFIPQIARQMIELISKSGELILDPYCGSGTSVLESMLLNRRVVGLDLNPLATYISSAKCTPIRSSACEVWLSEFEKELMVALETVTLKPQVSLFESQGNRYSRDKRLRNPWYRKWFQPNVLRELTVIDQVIRGVPKSAFQRLCWIAFSDILRRSSNASGKYPNLMFDRRVLSRPLPGPVFLKKLKEVFRAAAKLAEAGPFQFEPVVLTGDARNLPIAGTSIDAIVTHPPYIGSVPYAEYQYLSLKWLGYDPKELDAKLTGGMRQKKDVLARFKSDLSLMLRECFRVLKHGRVLAMLVGRPVVQGQAVHMEEMVQECSSGFMLEAMISRNGVNRRANKMPEEKIIFLRKS